MRELLAVLSPEDKALERPLRLDAQHVGQARYLVRRKLVRVARSRDDRDVTVRTLNADGSME